MPVGFAGYEIARTGLWTNERALNVTGHNIANVNTAGYVRQQAISMTGPYQTYYNANGLYQLGLGADIQQVRQIRHAFLDNIYRQENTTLGYWESRAKTFQDIQAILGEPMGAGLQNVLNQFWDSWQELSKEPDSLTVRALVRQRGEAVIQQVNHLGKQLDKLQNDLNEEILVRINEVNNITSQIAKLNVKIASVEAASDSANDFRDQRNVLVDRLSKLCDADVTEIQDGQLAVTLGGYFIVNRSESTNLYAAEANAGDIYDVAKLEGTNIVVPIRGGIIKGLMESRGEVRGEVSSPENGSPYTKADIVLAVDVSGTDPANLDKIKAGIDDYINELNRPGIDYNIKLITYDENGVLTENNFDATNISTPGGFLDTVNGLSNSGDSAGTMQHLIDALPASDFREGANRYMVVFTGESLDGDTGTAADPLPYITDLINLGIKTSVVTDPVYNESGDIPGEAGWDRITSLTGGKLYDMNTDITDFAALMNHMAMDNVNDGISLVEETNNIIPDLKKRLNALINILAREVNYLHASGSTLAGNSGEPFFTAINDAYPLTLTNIRLNSNLSDLNNIVTSVNGENGDNTIALKIANLRNNPIMNDASGTVSMDEYYQSTILSVGSGGQDAERISENQRSLVASADAQRQAITGVSMDEEMTNMMRYKYAYDAAARALNVMDIMMETIIERMGLAGR